MSRIEPIARLKALQQKPTIRYLFDYNSYHANYEYIVSEQYS